MGGYENARGTACPAVAPLLAAREGAPRHGNGGGAGHGSGQEERGRAERVIDQPPQALSATAATPVNAVCLSAWAVARRSGGGTGPTTGTDDTAIAAKATPVGARPMRMKSVESVRAHEAKATA